MKRGAQSLIAEDIKWLLPGAVQGKVTHNHTGNKKIQQNVRKMEDTPALRY